jgi:hypothetical protein
MTDADRLTDIAQAPDICAAMELHMNAVIGHKLFTLMVVDRAANEAARLYSSAP